MSDDELPFSASDEPTHRAYARLVSDGPQKRFRYIEIGTVHQHRDGKGCQIGSPERCQATRLSSGPLPTRLYFRARAMS
jgi:hypothetical protein